MKINIKELGAIKEATIDLDKPLSIFCGQNNTGKTYLAYIIYAISRIKISKNPLKINIPQLIEKGEITIEINNKDFYEYRNKILVDIKLNLNAIYGISDELVERMFSGLEIKFLSDYDSFNKKLQTMYFEETISFDLHKFKFLKERNKNKLKIQLSEGIDYKNILDNKYFEILLTSVLSTKIAFYPVSNAVIFPVERNSIFTFSKELSINRNMLVDQMQKLSKGDKLNPLEILQNSSNRYPLAITDGLKISNDLQNIQKIKSSFYDIAEEIEEKLMCGSLMVNRDGSVEFISNKNKGRKIPIHMTASLIKTLSSLVFYLKYTAEKNDLIIIDEPEMNLHPDNQILLTRLFAMLLNRGFRLLISTHSDYIVREFNNLIMASNEKAKKIANEYKYDENISIKPEDVGCYYFHFSKPNAKQVVVKQLNVDEFGFEVESIDKEINAQNEIAMSMFYEINKKD